MKAEIEYLNYNESDNHWFKCLECEFEYILDNFKFCPNCGLEIDWNERDWSESESTN